MPGCFRPGSCSPAAPPHARWRPRVGHVALKHRRQVSGEYHPSFYIGRGAIFSGHLGLGSIDGTEDADDGLGECGGGVLVARVQRGPAIPGGLTALSPASDIDGQREAEGDGHEQEHPNSIGDRLDEASPFGTRTTRSTIWSATFDADQEG